MEGGDRDRHFSGSAACMLGSYGKLLDGGQIIVGERGGKQGARGKGREGRHSTTIFEECIQGRKIILGLGLVKFVPAVAGLVCSDLLW